MDASYLYLVLLSCADETLIRINYLPVVLWFRRICRQPNVRYTRHSAATSSSCCRPAPRGRTTSGLTSEWWSTRRWRTISRRNSPGLDLCSLFQTHTQTRGSTPRDSWIIFLCWLMCSEFSVICNSLIFSAFFFGKKTLMLSPCPSVCLSVSQFSLKPQDTLNSNFQCRSIYTYAGNNPNLVHFRQCAGDKL